MNTPHEIAARMSLEEAAEILTLTDEPGLILNAGEVPPTFPADVVAAARIVSNREMVKATAELAAMPQEMRERFAFFAAFSGVTSRTQH